MASQPYRIQIPSDQLRALLTAFGVVTPPALWELENSVQPVSIVDSRVALQALQTPLIWGIRQSAGEQTAAPANTRHFDTGQLAAGTWDIQWWLSAQADEAFRLKQRNAADAADVNSIWIGCRISGTNSMLRSMVFKVAVNERIVMENITAIGAGVESQAVVWATQLE